jgi:hypothetical protein
VFPDAAEQVVVDRLAALRLAQLTGLGPQDVPDGRGPQLLEGLGAGWYRLAARGGVQAQLAEEFYPARRVLNAATDRYLLPVQTGWFGAPRP